MFLLFRLSLRNLFRQKRRNLLLGSAMAIGVMLLVVANSFSTRPFRHRAQQSAALGDRPCDRGL